MFSNSHGARGWSLEYAEGQGEKSVERCLTAAASKAMSFAVSRLWSFLSQGVAWLELGFPQGNTGR